MRRLLPEARLSHDHVALSMYNPVHIWRGITRKKRARGKQAQTDHGQ